MTSDHKESTILFHRFVSPFIDAMHAFKVHVGGCEVPFYLTGRKNKRKRATSAYDIAMHYFRFIMQNASLLEFKQQQHSGFPMDIQYARSTPATV
mmetsp:Transcript_55831/g.64475  ORF Transcript_55831/g.64475 Transcript_55831/m.64475 type:complete len:95 (-) Transcript_55831:17-301(-)